MTFTLSVRARTMSDELHRMAMSGGPFHHRAHRTGRTDANEIPPEVLRFGLQFADGRKATSVGAGHWAVKPRPHSRRRSSQWVKRGATARGS